MGLQSRNMKKPVQAAGLFAQKPRVVICVLFVAVAAMFLAGSCSNTQPILKVETSSAQSLEPVDVTNSNESAETESGNEINSTAPAADAATPIPTATQIPTVVAEPTATPRPTPRPRPTSRPAPTATEEPTPQTSFELPASDLPPYNAHAPITDYGNKFVVNVPTVWLDVVDDTPENVWLLQASPDIDTFLSSWDAPGFSATAYGRNDYLPSSPSEALDQFLDLDCIAMPREETSLGGEIPGLTQQFVGCGENNAHIVAFAFLAETEGTTGLMIEFFVQLTSQRDIPAFQIIIETLTVDV